MNPGRQALLALVYLRKKETFAQLAAGFEVAEVTTWRYAEEAVTLLSARSPQLVQALRRAKKDKPAHPILGGTLIV